MVVTTLQPNHLSRIVCIGVRWNLLGQVGGTPGVGSAGWPLYKEGVGATIMTAPPNSFRGGEVRI